MPKSVQLIDPIEVVSTLPNQFNGTPEYERMFIFAELTASRRGRSVLINTEGVITSQQSQDIQVNLGGVNNDDPSGDIKLTTKWTDSVNNTEKILEGFGMSRIEVKVSSSFIPQVTIEFTDIRGLAFFNLGENSPYSILLNFPPPLFKLTLKGYYGKALEYDLHLVRQSTRFEADTGNYYITAEFIARTFAPLTDIPFKMIDILPLLSEETIENIDPKSQPNLDGTSTNTINPNKQNIDQRVRPKNTHELIKKLKSLYDRISNLKDNSELSNEVKDIRQQLNNSDILLSKIQNFSNLLDTNLRSGSGIIVYNFPDSQDNNSNISNEEIRLVQNINAFNDIIKDISLEGLNKNIKDRLYLGVLKRTNIGSTDDEQVPTQQQIDENLISIKNELLSTAAEILVEANSQDDINNPQNLSITDSQGITNQYRVIDITFTYIKLYKFRNKKNTDLQEAKGNLVKQINELAFDELGMKPSAFEIFRILCNDVDTAFNVIRNTSVAAERHHNTFSDQILGNSSIPESKIGPFPLYIETEVTGGVKREQRAFPENLSESLDRPFPEVNLVNAFTEAFIRAQKELRVQDLKTQEDGTGNNKWIPVTPLDSELSPIADLSSPYANIELTGAEDNIINSIYNTILNRFYIASQYTVGRDFYKIENQSFFSFLGFGQKELTRQELIKLFAGADAVNLANSLINQNTIRKLEDVSKVFKTNPDQFYTTVQETVSNFSNITPNDSLRLQLQDGPDNLLIKNRGNDNFVGFTFINTTPTLRSNDIQRNNPVDIYIETNTDFYNKYINSIFEDSSFTEFSEENVPYYPDLELDNSEYRTRFVYENNLGGVVGIWSNYLALNDLVLTNIITGGTYTNEEIGFFLLSNFGFSHSFFDEDINSIFRIPGIVEVPRFMVLYMGGLVKYVTDNNFKSSIDILFEFDDSIVINTLQAKDQLAYDAENIVKLGQNDSDQFLQEFESYIQDNNNDGFLRLKNKLVEMIEFTHPKIQENDETTFITNLLGEQTDRDIYANQLTGTYGFIMDSFNEKVSILVHTTYTFSLEENVTDVYQPLSITNQDTSQGGTKSANDIYFKEFFRILSENLPTVKEDIEEQDVEFTSRVQDRDIKNQLYYTFKAISDKWVSGFDSKSKGFPLNRGLDDPLINKFIFVDRAMNPIGSEVILNAESLLTLIEDYDINIFTAFSRLLSLNGFEIFPLQNFMVHDNNDWEDAFRIFETVNQPSTPLFVCMYIGGTSTTLNNPNSDFDNDGILDLSNENLPDFDGNVPTTEETNVINNVKVANSRERFLYKQVKAFRVRYAEQNQSFFNSIQLDTREFPETAESLAILSNIAGDNSASSPVPKGQNLYNLYENRAYTCKVSMLGNVMIQPTQYFQLENIPLYNGAYLITDVEHNIEPNHMMTNFQGVKILKYPNPFVKEFATVIGIDSGTSEDTSGSKIINEQVSASKLPLQDFYNNSMFELSISP